MDKDQELRMAMLRSARAHAAYAEVLGQELSPGPGEPPTSSGNRMKELQEEVEAADTEVARLKDEALGTPSPD